MIARLVRSVELLDVMPPPDRRIRTLIGIAFGIFGAWLCEFWGGSPYDFSWPLRAASDLLAGRDPYDYPFHNLAIPYPLPAAFVGLLFHWLPDQAAGVLFFGVSSGLLAAGITRNGYAGLMLFLSGPYILASQFVQWSPLIAAAAFFAWLQPLILIKPQIAIPIVLPYLRRSGVVLTIMIGLASLLIYPTWPLRWFNQIGDYERFIPLLTFPVGPLLLLGWLRRHDPRTQTFLLAAIMPQRALYDLVILWIIPRRWVEALLVTLLSWLWALDLPITEADDALLCGYFPMLFILLTQRSGKTEMVS